MFENKEILQVFTFRGLSLTMVSKPGLYGTRKPKVVIWLPTLKNMDFRILNRSQTFFLFSLQILSCLEEFSLG